MNGDVKAIFSLYRKCLRQIRRLPTVYLRSQFFRLRVGDDVRVILNPKHAHLQSTKIKRDLWKLEGANAGYAKCFDYILNTAYGRRGSLRWEILNPLRSEPGAELPPRIIPAVESSRPPQYSKEMKALLTSDISHMTRALTPAALLHPPILPPRADPNSPEARALGPFSKRREVNLRWRFFQQEVQKTALPLQVVVEEPQSDGSASRKTDGASLARVGIRSIGLQDSGVFEEIEALALPPSKGPLSAKDGPRNDVLLEKPKPTFESHLPTRFLRRRYQQLLARIPVLAYVPPRTTPKGVQAGKYQVKQSPHAVKRFAPVHATAGDADMAWIRYAESSQRGKSR
ncbi:hypothetical protein BN946_scf185007.g50 [Trametes cinnabarina]|uniref:LYR motif-containing protein Cup1-like N-terminal domain-containing protein n=1 Tax=Pycnoporus cinnabarinus TaxID=5643 RepID=A0A060SFK9_PYCCI|nr:hypothetical protein BN946_scf185007.g50 [Trametes cinnabarina]